MTGRAGGSEGKAVQLKRRKLVTLLHEDKAYCLGAVEFQTAPRANFVNADVVQRGTALLPALSSRSFSNGPAQTAKASLQGLFAQQSPNIFTQIFLTISLAPFSICCTARRQVWCRLEGGGQPR